MRAVDTNLLVQLLVREGAVQLGTFCRALSKLEGTQRFESVRELGG